MKIAVAWWLNSIGELSNTHAERTRNVTALFKTRKVQTESFLKRAIRQGKLPKTTAMSYATNLNMTFICGFNSMAKVGESCENLQQISNGFLAQPGF